MENIETTNDDLEKFREKYEVTWLQEIKTTVLFTVGLIALCGALFLALFFTRDITKDHGVLTRFLTIFENSIEQSTLQSNLQQLTSKPHYAGTPESDEMGNFLQGQLHALLGDRHVTIYNETYEVLLPFPQGVSTLTISNGTVTESAQLYEERIPDPAKKIKDDPSYAFWNYSWLAYSKNGVADGKLFYVNYGRVEDFNVLTARVNLTGKIVIARYGKIFRGQIVKTAESLGCVGVILYSDPQDDGADVGDVYPNGMWRPAQGLQRGSSMYLAQQPGDPTTPNKPSLPGTRHRISRDDATNVPNIQVLAISARDAFNFLKHLTGDVVTDDWKGGLTGDGFAYRYGTDDNGFNVHMVVNMVEKFTNIHNYFAKIEGKSEPDRIVMLGNHRDPWTYGAVDPHSGTIVLLEVAKGLGRMLKSGWQPRRTVILALWDAEEQGLIGSTEFVEQYRENLRNTMVAYINVDTFFGDIFSSSGPASMTKILTEVTQSVQHPSNNGTVFDVSKASKDDKHIIPKLVGSGSDYTAFYHHIGVAIVDLTFREKNGKMYGNYHSIYDNYAYFTKFIDPDFKLSMTMTKIAGRVLLKLSDEVVLPFDILTQANVIESDVNNLTTTAEWIDAYNSFNDTEKAEIDKIYNNLQRSASAFQDAGTSAHEQYIKYRRLDRQSLNYETNIRSYNDRVSFSERGFVTSGGLPGRPWYKHVISAPGKDLGYGFEVFPAVKEALRADENRLQLLVNALSDLSESLDSATTFVTGTFSERNTVKAIYQ